MLINTSCNRLTAATSIIASIGAINWGLIGILDLNLVTYLLGDNTIATRIAYAIVGFSGMWCLCSLSKVLCSPGIKAG